MPKLYVLSGPDTGKSFELEAGALVGRDPECAVRLRDPSVSRKHARVEHGERGWSIVDTQSRNGIRVEGKRVATVELADGGELTLGEVLLRFREQVARPVPAAQEPGPVRAAPLLATPIAPPTPPPIPADDAEIVLEGDWESAPTRTSPPADRSPDRPSNRQPEPSDPTRGPATFIRPALQATSTVVHRADDPVSTKRPVLQYQRVADRPGFFHADLAQQPWWMKLLLAIAALLAFAALFWLVFRGTSFLKSKAQTESTEAEAPEER
jgi:pSer/pThr/pTyr-binding forkhead associated (FHA) protein